MSTSKTQTLADDIELAAGIEKHLSTVNLIVESKPETGAELLAVASRRIHAAQAVLDARSALRTAILRSDDEHAATGSYVGSLRLGIHAMYANSPNILGDFGLVARRSPKPLTAAEKILAVERRAATRAARHTLGKDQRAAIKGTLAGPVVVALDGTAAIEEPSSPATPEVVARPSPAVTANGSSTPRS